MSDKYIYIYIYMSVVLCLIKHDNECFEYDYKRILKYDYKRILIRMNHYIIILIRMNNYIMPHALSDIKSLHVTYYG